MSDDLFEDVENGAAWARFTDPDTSRAAANSIRGEQATVLETCVIRALMKFPSGLAAFEIIELTGVSNESLTPRLAPLRRKGLIKDSGLRRIAPSNRQQIVWIEGDGIPVVDPTLLPEFGELVVVAQWSDFEQENVTLLGKFLHRGQSGHFYISGSHRGWPFLKRLRGHTLNYEDIM